MNRAQQNTWRTMQGLPTLPTMEEIVAKLQHYVETYDKQEGFEDYTDETLIDDVIYGLGAALGKEYQFADGFRKFEARLVKHIKQKQDAAEAHRIKDAHTTR